MEKIASLQSTNIQSNNNNNEHKRQLLLGILRQRGIFFDSQTGKIIDDKASIETLLRVLQKEKQKKKKQQQEVALPNTNKSSEIQIRPYEFINDLLDVIYKSTVKWLLFLTLNSFTAWFWTPLRYPL